MAVKSNYWLEKRIANLLADNEIQGKNALQSVLPLYEGALKNIQSQIQNVYDNYVGPNGVEKEKLRQIINGTDRAKFLKSVKANMQKVGLDVNRIYDDGKLMRLNRLEALKEQMYWQIMAIAPNERDVTGRTYADIVQNTYQKTHDTVAKGYGITNAFATLDGYTTEAILREKWLGQSYSNRVWGNVNELALKLPEIVGSGIISGEAYGKTIQRVRTEFGVKYYEAQRLVLTETAYFSGRAELKSYNDDGIEWYEFSAILDKKTSKICEDTNNQRFRLSEAVTGVNYPPLHPWCRSTTYPILEDDPKLWAQTYGQRSGDTGKVIPPEDLQPIQLLGGGQALVQQKPIVKQPVVQQTAPANDDMVKALHNYQTQNYRFVNSYLRGDRTVNGDFVTGNGQTIDQIITNIDKLMGTAKTPEAVTIYRGLSLDNIGKLYKGHTVIDEAFSSYSTSMDVAKQFTNKQSPAVLVIDLPKGSKALQVGKITGYLEGENEYLLPRNNTLQITGAILSKDGSTVLVSAKLVPTQAKLPDYGQAFIDNYKALTGQTIGLTEYEKYILDSRRVQMTDKLDGKRRDGTNGYYNNGDKKITLTKAGSAQEQARQEHTIKHEIGHAIDYSKGTTMVTKRITGNITMQVQKDELHSDDSTFYNLVYGKDRLGFEIVKNRLGPMYKEFADDQVNTLLRGGVAQQTSGEPYKMNTKWRRYALETSELFAEGYAMYRTQYDQYKDKLSTLFAYYDQLTNTRR
jgi:SPP1 gp7 family putative phage head morphogenesis protein